MNKYKNCLKNWAQTQVKIASFLNLVWMELIAQLLCTSINKSCISINRKISMASKIKDSQSHIYKLQAIAQFPKWKRKLRILKAKDPNGRLVEASYFALFLLVNCFNHNKKLLWVFLKDSLSCTTYPPLLVASRTFVHKIKIPLFCLNFFAL